MYAQHPHQRMLAELLVGERPLEKLKDLRETGVEVDLLGLRNSLGLAAQQQPGNRIVARAERSSRLSAIALTSTNRFYQEGEMLPRH